MAENKVDTIDYKDLYEKLLIELKELKEHLKKYTASS